MSRDFMNDEKFWDNYTKTITEMSYEEQSAMEYNERMQNESDKHSEYEYMEMKSMYEEGLLEC